MAELVVAADGTNSFTRQVPGWNNHFRWTTLKEGCTCPDDYVETDYALGVGLHRDDTSQPQWLNTVITLSQNRYLFNSVDGKEGYLNIRITEDEFRALRSAAQQDCNFTKPCVLYRFGVEPTGVKLNESLQHTIDQCVKIFGLTRDHIKDVVAFPLTPAYAQRFVYKEPVKEGSALNIALIGDAAMSHHFWPGRGLNSGLNAAVALARNLLLHGVDNFDNFEKFMNDLREREMQGRSASMLRKENALPSELINKQKVEDDVLEESLEESFANNVIEWTRHMKTLPRLPENQDYVESKIRDKFLRTGR